MNKKSLMALLLAALMTFSMVGLASATSPGEAVIAAQEAFENASSYTATMELAMGMTISEITADITMLGNINAFVDPMKLQAEMTMSIMGQEMKMSEYVVPNEDGTLISYSYSDMDGFWTSEEIAVGDSSSQFDVKGSLGFFSEVADTLAVEGEEDIRGSIATKYAGIMSGEDIGNMADGALSAFDMSGSDITLQGELPISIWIDNTTGLPVRYSMDLSTILAPLLGLQEGMALNSCVLTMDITGIDNAVDFELPADALQE